MAGDEDQHVSWARASTTPGTGRRDRDERRFFRPDSLLAILVVLAVDALAYFLVIVALFGSKLGVGLPCSTFWRQTAHYALVGVWFVSALVVVSVALAAWRRWHLVAVVGTQLVVAAFLVPTMLHTWSDASAVADGRKPASSVSSDQRACDPFH